MKPEFIPCTREIDLGKGNVVYRPIRSWHSGTEEGERGEPCRRLFTVTHRLYWRRDRPDATISAFLSYPNAMGHCGAGVYFWEAYIGAEPERFTGENAETKMEEAIVGYFDELQIAADLRERERGLL